ncbi:MAG: sensor domain-containing diguanylate cyclase, partial [Aquificae bacterium]|nr:sensor domain-containing diguanylate cyclase [Aquificota bacterium]
FKYYIDDIGEIENRYMDLIEETLQVDASETKIRRKATNLGKYLFERNVSFMLILDVNNQLVPYITSLVSEEVSNGKSILAKVSQIEERIRYIEGRIAYGYLTENIKQDKSWIREKLKIIRNSESSIKPFIREHLVWVNKVLEDIRKLRTQSSVILGHYNTEIGKKLESVNGFGLFDEYRDEMITLHKKLHGSAIQIYHFLQSKDFKHLLLEYMEFFNLVGKFVSMLGLTFAVMYEEDANIDPLTKVLSRRSLEFILSSQFHISKISKRPLSIAMVDIDDFKRINDTYGHQVGDCVLKQVAQRIQENLRKSDFIFRYGGEEFLILLPFTSKEDAVKVLEKVVKTIAQTPIKCNGMEERITVSAGVASIENAKDIYSLIAKADRALYRAKKQGKNRVAV